MLPFIRLSQVCKKTSQGQERRFDSLTYCSHARSFHAPQAGPNVQSDDCTYYYRWSASRDCGVRLRFEDLEFSEKAIVLDKRSPIADMQPFSYDRPIQDADRECCDTQHDRDGAEAPGSVGENQAD